MNSLANLLSMSALKLTKDGNEYEPTSLRSLMASFERNLKKQGYSASIINDLIFEKTRKVLQSMQKQLKKLGKGNKPKASVALTSEELKILYERGFSAFLVLRHF